ncbi:Gfo/Idh/MocA family protein [Hyperthermus butylicus]|uniref:Gfo/Idh/MocA family protein n=1 Tax=Hyperthermus butylicus TaxID=54248 RepID=UPI001E2A6565|nr:Gfo/Idh/MocA family oxidoreductase [Hyperthermus butylicus]
MLRVAVVGAGYMGTAHARVLARIADEHPGLVELAYVVDVDPERARRVAARYGGKPVQSVRGMGEVDLAIVSTPTETHLAVFRELLGKTRAVLVEKPMASSLSEAVEMLTLAREHGVWLAVGHIERFNPAVRALHERVARRELGDILTIVARRVGPFAPRAQNTDVVYDLGVHEVDNALVVYRGLPETVRSYTLGGLVSRLTDYALIILGYGEGFASIEVNRITPFKQRMLYLTTRAAVAYLDYMEQVLRIHRGHEEATVVIRREEPLYLEDLAVVSRFASGEEPDVDGYQGFLALYVCELALESRLQRRDIDARDNKLYSHYQDLVEEGLRRLKAYTDKLA